MTIDHHRIEAVVDSSNCLLECVGLIQQEGGGEFAVLEQSASHGPEEWNTAVIEPGIIEHRGPKADDDRCRLGVRCIEARKARDLMVVLESQAAVLAFVPDHAVIAALDAFALIVTAPGDDVDFVSRFFAPGAGVPEDPVTGSAHCTLIPYWAARLGKSRLTARQLSARGGELACELRGDRVKIGGKVAPYLAGVIDI